MAASLRFSPEFATAMAIDANRSRRPGCASRIAENASSLSFAAAICQASLDSRIDSISRITLNRTPTDGNKWAEWLGGGSLYFMIRDADLAARRFDRCEFEMQGT